MIISSALTAYSSVNPFKIIKLFQGPSSFSQLTCIDVFGSKATEDHLKMAADNAAPLTNGGGKGDVSDEPTQSSYNSLSSEHPDKKSEDGPDVPVFEDELHPISKLPMCENEEAEGTLVIRAERVVVTEEGNEVHEDLVALPDQLQVAQSEEGQGAAAMEETKTDVSTPGDDDDDDGTEPTAEEDLHDFSDASTDGPAKASETAALSPVPVYGGSTLSPEVPLEATAAEMLPGESQSRDPVPAAGHFQDVPLAEPQQRRRAEEQEPLLSQTAAPDLICSEAEAAVSATCSPAAQSATRGGQGEDTQPPKHKSCQCCSVM